jgi:hypothetical protein
MIYPLVPYRPAIPVKERAAKIAGRSTVGRATGTARWGARRANFRNGSKADVRSALSGSSLVLSRTVERKVIFKGRMAC